MARSLIGTLLNRSPVPLIGSGGGALGMFAPQSSEVSDGLDAMGAVGTLFAIVNRTSNATSQVDWRLYRKTDREEDRTEVTSHAALDLWNHPNPTTGRQLFVEGTQQHIDLTGEGWWVIARSRMSPVPLELWYVRPDKMSVVVGRSEITGYVYNGPKGEKVPLRPDQVISLRMPNPNDPWRGLGPVQSVLTEIDSHRFSMEWNRRFFQNSAQPGGILETPATLSDPEFQQLSARWREQHQSVNNAHRVAILEGGLKWVDRQMSMRDMQFSELREVSRDIIRESFGFPKSMLGASDDVNRANAEAGEQMFGKWLVKPRLERIKGALNNHLLPLFGDTATDLEFDYEPPTDETSEDERLNLSARSEAAATLVRAGWNADEVLETVGLPAMSHTGAITGLDDV